MAGNEPGRQISYEELASTMFNIADIREDVRAIRDLLEEDDEEEEE